MPAPAPALADPPVALLGLGLMGGSLGLALRAAGYGGRVTAYARRAETRDQAARLRVADGIFDSPAAAAHGAAVVVACAPVFAIPELIRASRPGLAPDAVVTDVGSTKLWLEGAVPRELDGATAVFVGSHPVCGSEQQGLDAARADLYRGAVTVVCAPPGDSAAAARVAALWARVGSRVLPMTAATHDRIIARTSHLPHLAAALVAAACAASDPDAAALCGAGFRDTTRVAEGAPDVWMDIVRSNRKPLADTLADLGARVERLRRAIADGKDDEIRRVLEEGREARRRLLGRRAHEAGGPPAAPEP